MQKRKNTKFCDRRAVPQPGGGGQRGDYARARTPPVRFVPIPCAGVNAVPGQPPRIATARRTRPSSSASGRALGTPAMLPSDRTRNQVRVLPPHEHIRSAAATAIMLRVKKKKNKGTIDRYAGIFFGLAVGAHCPEIKATDRGDGLAARALPGCICPRALGVAWLVSGRLGFLHLHY